MSRATLLLAVLLTSSVAEASPSADGPATPVLSPISESPRALLAAVMTDVGQALLLDRNRGSYVVVGVGDLFQGKRVTAILPDRLVLSASGQRYVLEKRSDLRPLAPTKAGPVVTHLTKELLPLDPYVAVSPSVLSRYETTGENLPERKIRTVLAPKGSRTTPSESAKVPSPGAPAVSAPATPAAAPVSTPAAAPVLQRRSVTLRRAEFDDVIDDFHALAREISLSVGERGIEVLELATGSYFHRIGIRKHDLIVSVGGRQIRSVEAAASVYAQLMGLGQFEVQIQRGEENLKLLYRFGA